MRRAKASGLGSWLRCCIQRCRVGSGPIDQWLQPKDYAFRNTPWNGVHFWGLLGIQRSFVVFCSIFNFRTVLVCQLWCLRMTFFNVIRFKTLTGKEFFGEPQIQHAEELRPLLENNTLFAVVLHGSSPFDITERTDILERVVELLPVL